MFLNTPSFFFFVFNNDSTCSNLLLLSLLPKPFLLSLQLCLKLLTAILFLSPVCLLLGHLFFVCLVEHLVPHTLRLDNLLLNQKLLLSLLFEVVRVDLFDPSCKFLLFFKLLLFQLFLFGYLVLKRLLYLLLFLYKILFLLSPHLFVKHFLVPNYFAPFVRWDLARNICRIFTSLYVQFTRVSSLRSFQSVSRTSESFVRKSTRRWLLLELCYRLQVNHTFPNVRFFLKALLHLVSIYMLSFYWFKQNTWLFVFQNTQVFNGKTNIFWVAVDSGIQGFLSIDLAFKLRQVRLILIPCIGCSCRRKWRSLPS